MFTEFIIKHGDKKDVRLYGQLIRALKKTSFIIGTAKPKTRK